MDGPEIPSPVTVVSQGHYTGELWGIDIHPEKTKNRFVTCGDDGTARLWDLVSKECIRTIRLGVIEQNEITDKNFR